MRSKFPFRETIFGLEDSIVSTLGVVVGIAAETRGFLGHKIASIYLMKL